MNIEFNQAIAYYNQDKEEEAFALLLKCAQNQYYDSYYMVARCYNKGEGVYIDLNASKYWMNQIEKMAENEHIAAQWDINCKYRWGDLVEKNIQKANYWIEKAAKNDHPEAQQELGHYHEFGVYDYPQDLLLANYWYQRAFQNNNPETIYHYGCRFLIDGKFTEEAIQLFKKAARLGFQQAQDSLDFAGIK